MSHFSVTIKPSHMNWGEYRHTQSRTRRADEGYVQIPKEYAVRYGILRGNTYRAVFADGFPSFQARAAGNTEKGDPYAKQFQGDGDLRAFGRWYASVNAQLGDQVAITFIDENTVLFELVPQ